MFGALQKQALAEREVEEEGNEQEWEDEVFGGSPKKAGLLAKNGKAVPVPKRGLQRRDKENSPIKVNSPAKSRAGVKKLSDVVVGERKRALRTGR